MSPNVAELNDLVRSLLDEPAARRLAWTLLHFLWQGAAAAAALTVLLALMHRAAPARRYAVACAVMALMVAAPVVTFLLLPPDEDGAASRRAAAAAPAGAVSVKYLRDAAPADVTGADAPATPRPHLSMHGYVVLPWLVGVLALAGWRVCGWLLLGRMIHTRTTPAAESVRRLGESLRLRLGIARAVRLVESAWVQVPSVVGVLRPVVLLPASALSGLSAAQLEAILAHELAHVRRRDYLVNLLQAAAETLLFYHPAVWWVSRRVREERELCCDEVAAEACGDRVLYARALADMESLRALPGALALSARGGSLARRVCRLLGVQQPPDAGGRAGSLAAGALAVCCVVVPLAAAKLGAAPEAGAATTDRFVRAPGNGAGADAAAANAGEPLEEDFVADTGDYRITPGDLLSVSIGDLQGPGVNTVKQVRVPNGGAISLPYIGALNAAGQTEIELEKQIAATYQNQKLIQNANVSVSVMEARGNTFSVMGDAVRPGVYQVARGDFRLLDALGAAQAGGGVEQVLVFRKAKDAKTPARVIRVPGDKLLAGEGNFNVVVRPGDVVRVSGGGEAPVVRAVVRPDGRLTIDGQDATWEQAPALLEKIAAARRGRATLLLVPASEDMTLRQMRDALSKAQALAGRAGLKEVTVAYGNADEGAAAKPAGEAAVPRAAGKAEVLDELPAEPAHLKGTYYVGGHATRPGAYTIGGRAVTLRQALVAAGLPQAAAAGAQVRVVRRGAGGDQEFRAPLEKLLEAGDRNGSAPLRDGDMILVGPEREAADR